MDKGVNKGVAKGMQEAMEKLPKKTQATTNEHGQRVRDNERREQQRLERLKRLDDGATTGTSRASAGARDGASSCRAEG